MSDDERPLPPPSRPAGRVSRREALAALAACLAGAPVAAAPHPGAFRLATFAAGVTPPPGHALLGGGIAPAREALDPLSARGFVLLDGGWSVVLAAIDWCEIRNDALDRWREALPGVFQVYATGCSGNVTAGKYNDGSPANRAVLAGRISRAMDDAWEATGRSPIERVDFRTVPSRLKPREGPGFTVEDLKTRLATDPKPFGRSFAALGLSWRERADAGHAIDVPAPDLGGRPSCSCRASRTSSISSWPGGRATTRSS